MRCCGSRSWLRAYRGTLLLVSHDREFLDRTVMRILHLEGGRLRAYTGNYSDFETQRAAHAERSRAPCWPSSGARLRTSRASWRASARRRARRARCKAASSGSRDCARSPKCTPRPTSTGNSLPPRKLPRPLVTLEKVGGRLRHAARCCDGVSLSVNPGDRLGVLGRNGAGKSTLMRAGGGGARAAGRHAHAVAGAGRRFLRAARGRAARRRRLAAA